MNKNEYIQVRVTATEKAFFSAKAKSVNITVAELIRRSCLIVSREQVSDQGYNYFVQQMKLKQAKEHAST